VSARPTVSDRVQRLLVEAIHADVTSSETDLIDAGLLDSLALVELLFALEREFDVSIAFDELDIEAFRSVDRITELVEKMQAAA
jgi:acyl carrier protein